MEEELPKERKRIPNVFAAGYILTAGFCDLIEIVLDLLLVGIFINRCITILYNIGVFLFFTFRGISPWHTKKLANNAIGFIIEFIPILDILPAKTVTAIINIMIVRNEDRAYNDKIKEEHNKNQPILKKQMLENQRREQRTVLVQQRELQRVRRTADLEEERQQKEMDEENDAAIREKQVLDPSAPYHTAAPRDLQNIGYRPIRKAA